MKKQTQFRILGKRILLLIMLFSFNLYAKDIYVAKDGNDNNPGTAAKPYKTIAKASSVAQAGDVIIIGEGTYEEIIRPARSGVAGRPITYTAKNGEKVIISAMQALSGWQKDRGSIYKTKVSWDLGQENFVMNGSTAMDLARWPNNVDGKPFTLNSLRNDGGSGSNVVNGAYLTSSQIPNIDWTGGAVFFYGDKPGSGWIAWKEFITSSSSSRVNFKLDKNPTWIRTFHDPASKGDFYLEGVKGALDYQNEWWFNSNTKELFVQMPGGGAPVDGKVQMRRREVAIDLNGRSYIEVKNLAVFGGAILLKTNSNNNKLYGISSFYGNHTQGVFRGFNAGKPSVEVNGTRNIVEKCEIAFSAATGVRLGGKFNELKNNYIHDFNYLGSYDAPLVARGGTDNKIKGNTIFNGGRDGINFNGNRCEIAYNDVYKSNLIADDCATFYTVGGPQNTEIHHNWFHDSASRGSKRKAAGIYLDNDAEAFSVHHNVVWNVEWTGVQINWNGKDIDIFNNTLVKTEGGAMGAWHKPGTAFSNVKVWNNIADVETVDDPTTQEDEGTFERDADKQNNVITKSGFANYNGNKFMLTSSSPAVNAGRQISGITNGYVGSAPDAGAYEYGGENWVPGIDWNPQLGPTGQGCYGLPGESCNDTGIQDSVEFVNAATTIPSKTSYNFEIKYSAKEKRDIIVGFWSSTGWVAGNTVQVDAGSGTVNVTIDLPNAPTPGEGYIYKTHIRPLNTSWQDALDADQVDNVTVQPAYQDKVSFTNAATTIAPSNSYTFEINYEASTRREIVVEFWSATNWLGQENVEVDAGAGTTNVTVNLSNPPATGTGYVYKLHIRPIGSGWQDAIDRDQINNVTVSQPYEDKVSFKNAPTTIVQATSYSFDIDYEASTDREIAVEFWSSTNWLGQQNVIVSRGTGTQRVTVNLANLPPVGTGYVYKVHIRPLNTTWRDALDRDQVNGVIMNTLNTQIIADGTYLITSPVNDQRLLSRTLESHSAVMVNPGNYDDQKWVFTHLGDDVYTIKNKGTNRYLEVPYAACANGTNVATWTNATDAHKQWKVVVNGTGIYGLKPMHCLGTGLDRAAGKVNANVQIWGYSSNNANQKWKIIADNTSSKNNVTREIAGLNMKKLVISPNPVKEILKLHNVDKDVSVKIVDMTGKLVLSKTIGKKELDKNVDVSLLMNGIYFISVENSSPVKFLKE